MRKINWRYAIGEFLIVVVSIVVAFQLDACKEIKDKATLRKEYLADIEVELRSDSLYFEFADSYLSKVKNQIDSTERILESGESELSSVYSESLQSFSSWYFIYVSNTAFQDLNNSGRLNLIEFKEMRYNIISYYQYIDFIEELDRQYSLSIIRMLEELLTRLDFREKEILRVPEEDISTVLNYLRQKRKYIDSYLSQRSMCQNINNNIREQIANM